MRLLVVDENPERSDVVLAGLKEAGYDVVATISKDDDLRQSIKAHQPDLIIIDLESPYRDYLENLITINRENPRPIAMFEQYVGRRRRTEQRATYCLAALPSGLVQAHEPP